MEEYVVTFQSLVAVLNPETTGYIIPTLSRLKESADIYKQKSLVVASVIVQRWLMEQWVSSDSKSKPSVLISQAARNSKRNSK